MECPTVGQLYDYAKNKCESYPELVRAIVDEHITGCQDCQHFVKKMKELVPSLKEEKIDVK
jgi:predicted nucleic acid-binding Zn ribbon protein